MKKNNRMKRLITIRQIISVVIIHFVYKYNTTKLLISFHMLTRQITDLYWLTTPPVLKMVNYLVKNIKLSNEQINIVLKYYYASRSVSSRSSNVCLVSAIVSAIVSAMSTVEFAFALLSDA